MPKPTIMNLSDIDIEEVLKSGDQGGEQKYRRGFHQGAAQVFGAIKPHLTKHQLKQAEKWFEEVQSWRSGHSEQFMPPNGPKL